MESGWQENVGWVLEGEGLMRRVERERMGEGEEKGAEREKVREREEERERVRDKGGRGERE